MNKLIVIIAFVISFTGIAQSLESKIPSNAKAVVEVNGDAIFDLIAVTDINSIGFIKEELLGNDKKSIEDFGFDINKKAYYFYQATDSTQIHNLIVNLKDKSKFEALLSKRELKNKSTAAGFNIIYDGKSITAWNDTILILSVDKASYDNEYSYNDYNDEIIYEEIEEEVIEEEEPEPVFEDNYEIEEVEEEIPVTRKTEEVEEEVEIEETVLEDYGVKLNDGLRNNIINIINTTSRNSIITNKSYQAGKDKKAVAHFWVRNYSEMIGDLLKSSMAGAYPYGNPYGDLAFSKDMFGMEAINSNLFFNKDEVRLSSYVNISDNWIDTYKRMYNSSLSKNFLKYINEDNTLGYFSISTDTQAMLEEYPKLMSNIYGNMLPKYKEETAVVLDLIAVMLDEKAIGELITGDMLFVLNDLSEKEITYKSYTYDDDYNSTEVTKTKKEFMPDFTVMIGSENKQLITKLLNLGTKHKVLEASTSIFKINKQMTRAPFDLFFTVKNDILFLTNSQKQVNSISKNTFKKKLGKHKKMLKKNIFVGYLDMQKIINKIPAEQFFNGENELKLLNFVENNVTEAYTTASKLKGNKFRTEQVMKTSGKHGNSLNLLLEMVKILSVL